jgi:hypothetical protein
VSSPIELERKDPELERILLNALRKMSPSEKVNKVNGMIAAMYYIAMSDVKVRYPEADEYECRLRVASRRVPPDLMLKAFGWDVKQKGY